MTQDILSSANPWIGLVAACVLGFVLSIILAFSHNLNEDGTPRRKHVKYKPNRKDRLISLAIGIIMFCLIVIILTIMLVVIGNQLNVAMIDFANCTTALASG